MSGVLYAGDVGVEFYLTMQASAFAAVDVATARLMVAGPAVAPGPWPTVEWPVDSITSQTDTDIEILVITDGVINGAAGDVKMRAYFYDIDGAIIGRSTEFAFRIVKRYVDLPEAP